MELIGAGWVLNMSSRVTKYFELDDSVVDLLILKELDVED